MPKLRKDWPLIAVFWAITALATALTWRFLPTTASQVAFSLLITISVISALLRNGRVAGLTAMFFVLISVNYWLLDDSINGIIGGVCIIAATIGIGYWAVALDEQKQGFELTHWLLLGLGVAEVTTILSYWPISFFNRTLLSGVGFYFFWQLLEAREEATTKQLVNHFLFVTLTVMVVVGSILWANFPQLTPF